MITFHRMKQMSCGIGASAQSTLDECSWSRSQYFYKVEPEIWVPVTQSKFVGQAS